MRQLPTLSTEDLEAMLETAIGRANAPLSVSAVIKALPAGGKPKKQQVESCLAELIAAGRIHPWPRNTFWAVSRASFTREQVLRALSSGPLTATEITSRVTRVKSLVKTALAVLVKEGTVMAHPKLETEKPFGLGPPDAVDYLRAVFEKLKKMGFQEAELQCALRRYVGHSDHGNGVQPEGGEVILAAMARLNSQVSRRALVYLSELRAVLTEQFRDKDSFDRVILDLAEQGKVQLQSHAWPGRLSEQEKDVLVPNGRGGFFDAIGLRLE